MIPSINFGFLMCTYLPGIPIILPIYVSFVSKVLEEIPEPAFKSSLIILYVIISPLIFGLLIDAIRHLFEYSSRWLLEKKLKAVEVGEERESLISVWTKKKCIFGSLGTAST